MSDQYDEPVVPRLATNTATGSGSFTQGESAPGAADQETATSGHSKSEAETPVVPRLGGTASASVGDLADPPSPAEYWSARDNNPVASRRGTADASADLTDTSDGRSALDEDSVIVILPEDIVTPDDEEKPKASEPTQPTLATEPIRWNASAAASNQEPPGADASREKPESAEESEPEDGPAAPSDVSDDTGTDWEAEADRDVSDDTEADSDAATEADAQASEPETGTETGTEAGDEADASDETAVDADRTEVGDGPRAVDGVADERWREIMVGFVDDPLASVEAAADLIEDEVAAYVARLAARQQSMRSGWNTGQDTEMLRLALRSYRDFRVRFTEEVDRVENAGG